MFPQRAGAKQSMAVHEEPMPPINSAYAEPFRPSPDSAQLRQSEKFFEAPNLSHYENHIDPSPLQTSGNPAPAFLSPVSAATYSATSPAFQISREQHYTAQNFDDYEKAHEREKRTPMMMFGMKWRTFLLVALVIVLAVVGAAVGGAVGGKNLQKSASDSDHSDSR